MGSHAQFRFPLFIWSGTQEQDPSLRWIPPELTQSRYLTREINHRTPQTVSQSIPPSPTPSGICLVTYFVTEVRKVIRESKQFISLVRLEAGRSRSAWCWHPPRAFFLDQESADQTESLFL